MPPSRRAPPGAPPGAESRLPAAWALFWLLAGAISLADLLAIPHADFRSAHGTEFIILYTVRCALPFFVIAFSASALAALWPGRGTRWLLANRRYFGLAFAFGMAWHLSFVAYSFWTFGKQLNTLVIVLDLIGLAFLAAMTLTSFRWCARHLSVANWRRLHKSGVYAIWLLTVYIYQYGARHDHHPLDIAALSVLLAAWLLRIAAWTRKRLARRAAP